MLLVGRTAGMPAGVSAGVSLYFGWLIFSLRVYGRSTRLKSLFAVDWRLYEIGDSDWPAEFGFNGIYSVYSLHWLQFTCCLCVSVCIIYSVINI